MERARIVLEVGTHSPWISRLLTELGHEVVVANPRKLRLIYGNPRKTDRADAEYLARVGRMDPELLAPVRHGGRQAQADRGVLRARQQLVRTRTQLINHVRGAVKSWGERLPSCATAAFARRVAVAIPDALRPALDPLVRQIQVLTDEIRGFDEQIERLCEERYPETRTIGEERCWGHTGFWDTAARRAAVGRGGRSLTRPHPTSGPAGRWTERLDPRPGCPTARTSRILSSSSPPHPSACAPPMVDRILPSPFALFILLLTGALAACSSEDGPTGPAPTAEFTVSPERGNTATAFQFDASPSASQNDQAVQTFVWRFGDGNGAEGVRTSHTYSSAGTYTVELTVTDGHGRTATAGQELAVLDEVELPIPANMALPEEPAFLDDLLARVDHP
ncbi:MAG: PKD domain-containing protein, partial [Gemmatimonadota bacterium]